MFSYRSNSREVAGVGVPIMLAYVYGVVPLSLCRNGGCGVNKGSSNSDRDDIDDDEIWHEVNSRKLLSAIREVFDDMIDDCVIMFFFNGGSCRNF